MLMVVVLLSSNKHTFTLSDIICLVQTVLIIYDKYSLYLIDVYK